MTYTIEETGLEGWMAYRYQYKAGAIDRFGYAETRKKRESGITDTIARYRPKHPQGCLTVKR
jgi:hypothetical protein